MLSGMTDLTTETANTGAAVLPCCLAFLLGLTNCMPEPKAGKGSVGS